MSGRRTTAGTADAAVWELPGTWKLGVPRQLALLPAMLGIFRRHSPRVLRSWRMWREPRR